MTARSAPGKVILFGEHAVVYGMPALAVPVYAVKAVADVSELAGAAAGAIRITAPGAGLDSWLHEMHAEEPLAMAVRIVLEEVVQEPSTALHIRVESEIPVASGMGSSAAVSVATVRAVAAHLGHELPPERASALAFEVEKLHHGTPSGIDNTVVAYAQPIVFVTGSAPQALNVETAFTLMIGDTGVPSPTREVVEAVRERWNADPGSMRRVFSEIGSITEQARQLIEHGEVGSLGPLMDRNQTLLKAIAVSSTELEHLIRVAKKAGALGAKLSGAGRGGVMISLVTPESSTAVEAALRGAGAIRTIRTEVRHDLP